MMNQYQRQLAGWLSAAGLQWVEEYPLAGYQIDLYLPELRLAVEVDGPHHGLQRKKDAARDESLLGWGVRTARIPTGTPKAVAVQTVLETAGS